MRLNVYVCPVHSTFKTLTVEYGSGSETRFFTSKCCVKQYANKIATWKLHGRELDEFIELLQQPAEVRE